MRVRSTGVAGSEERSPFLAQLADLDTADEAWSVADQVGERSHFRIVADQYRP
jgi:hypothetical protein